MKILNMVRSQDLSVTEALEQLKDLPYQDLDFAKLDHHRALRRGFPEVIFGEGKTPEQIARLAKEIAEHSKKLLITRASPKAYDAVRQIIPRASYSKVGRAIYLEQEQPEPRIPGLLLLTGGTADIPVAEEAAVTAEVMGNQMERVYDVGVAGIHRLLDHKESLRRARVIIVVAGMDGALASVTSGLVSVPVIGVPTSVGYGASFQGLAALLTMLNSCSPGVGLVNIDNGFGAGYLASMINQGQTKER